MKWSIYNIIKEKEGNVNIFNTLTRATVILEKNLYYQSLDKLPSQVIINLSELGIIVPKETDEFLLFNYWYNLKVTQKKFLGITYIPTYSCNFECPYCIEGKIDYNNKVKSKEIYSYINQKMAREKYDIVDFVFYGGEPLLDVENVISTAQFMKRMVAKYSKQLNMSMVTNGYLLKKDCVEKLESNGILTFQITVDGSREMHNLRRKHKREVDTYDVIIDNIRNILKWHKNINVVLNLNYDETNYNEILEFISNPPFDLKDVHIKLNPIKNSCKNIKKIGVVKHLNDAEILYKELQDKGLYDVDNVLNEYGPCLKRIRNSIIIDCYGDLYKCVFGVGNKLNVVGTIYDDLHYDIYSGDLIMKKECKNCSILPICMTGCPRLKKELDMSLCRKEELLRTFIEPIMDNF